ncbi:hypothetical protein BDZ89DRAFT_1215941 [Hymenopellis radicata]|nr:hypothetical protein BDZ89DRAFT_1215941 [Hymenopellis radicata]
MDLHEDAEKNVVTASFEFPGLKKEDVNIDVRDGRLTVTGESKISSDREAERYRYTVKEGSLESSRGRLSQGVKGNGVLTVTFPKAASESISAKYRCRGRLRSLKHSMIPPHCLNTIELYQINSFLALWRIFRELLAIRNLH